jgi:hypothetical protein
MHEGVEDLLASVEEEFGVAISDYGRVSVMTPNELVEYLISRMPAPSESMGEDEQMEHIEAVLGELMARTVGITRYDADRPIEEIVAAAS